MPTGWLRARCRDTGSARDSAVHCASPTWHVHLRNAYHPVASCVFPQDAAEADAAHAAARALFHTAGSPGEAWGRLAGALAHELALPDAEAAAAMGTVARKAAGSQEP